MTAARRSPTLPLLLVSHLRGQTGYILHIVVFDGSIFRPPFTSGSVLSQISYRLDISILRDITLSGSVGPPYYYGGLCTPGLTSPSGQRWGLPCRSCSQRILRGETMIVGRTQLQVVVGIDSPFTGWQRNPHQRLARQTRDPQRLHFLHK